MVCFFSPKSFSPSSVKLFFPTQKRAPRQEALLKIFFSGSTFFTPSPFSFSTFYIMFFYFYIRSVCFIFLFTCPFSVRPPPAADPLFFPPDACNQKKGMLRPSAACKFFTSPDDTGIPYAPHPPDPRRLYGRHPSDAISASHRVCRGSRLWALFRRLKRPV